MRLSIRTKIFAAIVAVSLSFIFLSILILNLFASSIAENEITTTLNQGRRAYERFVALRRSFVAAQARSLAQAPHLRAVMNVDDVDAETVQFTAGELNAAAAADLMLVVDRHGRLMADVHGTISPGADLSAKPGMSQGLQGGDFTGAWRYGEGSYRIVLTAILLENQLLGVLVLGDAFDDDAAAELRGFTGKDVLIVDGSRLLGDSREHPAAPITTDEIAAMANRPSRPGLDPKPFAAMVGSKHSLAIEVAAAGPITVILFRALDEMENAVDMMRLSIVGLGAASIAAAVLISWWLAVKMSRPVTELRDAAEQFGGGRLQQRVGVHSTDELGQLAASFNAMADSLDLAYSKLATFSRGVVRLQEEERRRVARELHDGVNQVLAGVRFAIESIEEKWPVSEQCSAELDRSKTLIDQVIQEIRAISRNLRPSVLDDLGLFAAVRSLCQEFEGRTGIETTLEANGVSGNLSMEQETALYRILQEAFNNVEKHARASRLDVLFTTADDEVVITVADNGAGFPAEGSRAESPGAGIDNMKERASLLEGTLDIHTTREQGTKIVVKLPIPGRSAETVTVGIGR